MARPRIRTRFQAKEKGGGNNFVLAWEIHIHQQQQARTIYTLPHSFYILIRSLALNFPKLFSYSNIPISSGKRRRKKTNVERFWEEVPFHHGQAFFRSQICAKLHFRVRKFFFSSNFPPNFLARFPSMKTSISMLAYTSLIGEVSSLSIIRIVLLKSHGR